MPSFSFSPAELSYLHTSLSSTPPIRPDARAPTAFRPLSAETTVLPATNGSAHLSFSDGSEAIVGVKLEVEQTTADGATQSRAEDGDAMDVDEARPQKNGRSSARPEWVTLTLTLPGVRDDDSQLVFLEQMLREALVSPATSTETSLQDTLVINARWHWHMFVDVVLISSYGITSYPLPLLSLTVHLALRDTKIPKLKSEGEEDPVADDDWDAALWLYPRTTNGKGKQLRGSGDGKENNLGRPPITLLVMIVGENVIFDPSREELAIADAVFAVSVGNGVATDTGDEVPRILAVRTIETQARDTMKGVALDGAGGEGVEVSGVWKPKVGGVKTTVLKQIMNAVTGSRATKSVTQEVVEGLEEFFRIETR